MKLGGTVRDGSAAGGGRAGLKSRAGQGKEKGGVMQMRRGMMGRAARSKVWEERIEEEEGEEEMERRMHAEVMGKGGGVGGCKVKMNEEIGVFDAERYFGGAERQAGWVREEEEELMEGEAGGDLPLSPLVEFGKGKWPDVGCGSGVLVQREPRGCATPSFGRRRVESSEFTSPRTSTASSLSEVMEPLSQQQRIPISQQAGKPKSKPQPASPSSRLASFLAKFKPPTPRKSPASSPIVHLMSSWTPPPPHHPAPPSGLSPAKKLLPNSLLVRPHVHGKAPSPRGRFLRAFSSSSADHAASVSLHHDSPLVATAPSMAASSPVSPAARSAPLEPYSPITHSAATTPTSARIPRTSPHSNSQIPSQPYNLNSSSCSKSSHRYSSGSFKQQLPFLSRKLKVYLMPDKVGADPSSKQENLARTSDKSSHGGIAGQGDHPRLGKHAPEEKQRRRWLHAEDQVVDEDIELAERLLRVVQDHQSNSDHHAGRSKPTTNHPINIHPTINQGVVNRQHRSSNSIHGYADRVSEYSSRKYDQMHPTANTSKLTISPHAKPAYNSSAAGAAKQGQHKLTSTNLPPTKEESSLYDSDSSSDLFEIETMASVGMGFYRRDLPVYEAKEHTHRSNHSFAFVSSSARPR